MRFKLSSASSHLWASQQFSHILPHKQQLPGGFKLVHWNDMLLLKGVTRFLGELIG